MAPGSDAAADELEQGVFLHLPWCQSILKDPEFAVEATHTRTHFPRTGENNLLANVLKTADTIEAWCSFYRRPTPSRPSKDEVRTLLSLQPGLNGYARICHGGITATLLDEISSMLVAKRLESQDLPPDNVTADLRIRFLKPVLLPGTFMVKAKITRIEREKKYFVRAEFVDSEARELATAEGLFVRVGLGKL